MELKVERLLIPEGANLILGQSHFIKTVEDLYEILVSGVPGIKFGLAFCESSGDCLIRVEGNDQALMAAATENARRLAAGHTFNILLQNAFPINVLNAIKQCPEVCLGVIDGLRPQGVEGPEGKSWRQEILRKLAYKK
ncbi:MAG: adenosine monophosphate-protein transferase [Desulfobacca sp. 4484_104]|nr:MAG: adenosine monophosphate-protein transferase [Desulfobacca sp. 4484_104]